MTKIVVNSIAPLILITFLRQDQAKTFSHFNYLINKLIKTFYEFYKQTNYSAETCPRLVR